MRYKVRKIYEYFVDHQFSIERKKDFMNVLD